MTITKITITKQNNNFYSKYSYVICNISTHCVLKTYLKRFKVLQIRIICITQISPQILPIKNWRSDNFDRLPNV